MVWCMIGVVVLTQWGLLSPFVNSVLIIVLVDVLTDITPGVNLNRCCFRLMGVTVILTITPSGPIISNSMSCFLANSRSQGQAERAGR